MALPRSEQSDAMLDLFRESYHQIEEDQTLYLITWNPKPRFYSYDKLGKNDYVMQWQTMLDKLVNITRCSKLFAFVAEISDVGKLHMHGWLQLNDPIKFHKSFLPTLRKNGYLKLNKANSHNWKTVRYHVKDLYNTSMHITDDDYPIVLTPNNVKVVTKRLTILKALVLNPDLPKKAVKKLNVFTMLKDAGLKFEDDDY